MLLQLCRTLHYSKLLLQLELLHIVLAALEALGLLEIIHSGVIEIVGSALFYQLKN